jgi:hypothetical protein
VEKAVWDGRAYEIARSYAGQVRLLHSGDDVEFVGIWSKPVASGRLDRMKACVESGTMVRGDDGRWRCRLEECRLLWEPGNKGVG